MNQTPKPAKLPKRNYILNFRTITVAEIPIRGYFLELTVPFIWEILNNMKKIIFAISLIVIGLAVKAQKVKLESGSLDVLRNEKTINIEFEYDGMSVGKYDTEKEYLEAKKAEYNKKEAGKGDAWAESWKNDRESRYQPRFIKEFTEQSNMTVDKTAKYTLIFKTTSTEPGYNVVVSRKNAEIDGEAWIVETADHSKIIAKIKVSNAPGRIYGGYDYDTGVRLQEAYATAGKKLGKYIK